MARQDIATIEDASGNVLMKLSLSNNTLGLFVKSLQSPAQSVQLLDFEAQGQDALTICDGKWHYIGVVWMCCSVNLFNMKWQAFFVKDGAVVDTLSAPVRAPVPHLEEALPVAEDAGPSGANLNVRFNGDITQIMLSQCPQFTAAPAVNTWFSPFYTTVPGQSNFGQSSDVFIPFYSYFAAEPAQWTNIITNQAVGIHANAVVTYDDLAFFLDGFSELVAYSPIEDFVSFNNNQTAAFAAIVQASKLPYANWEVDKFRGNYTNLAMDFGTIAAAFEYASYQDNQSFSAQDFQFVQQVMVSEFNAIMNLRAYFTNSSIAKDTMLNGLKGCVAHCRTDFGSLTPAQTKAGFNVLEVFEDIFEVAAVAGGEEAEVAMQIFKAFWSIANIVIEKTEGTPSETDAYAEFQSALGELESQLDDNFTSAMNNAATTMTLLLGNGGKLKAANTLSAANSLHFDLSAFEFSADAALVARIRFTRQLMLATFSCYATDNYLSPCTSPNVEVSAHIPSRFTASGSSPFMTYWAHAIGAGSAEKITVAPTEQLADLIFTQAKVSDFWSWGFATIECPWKLPPV